MQFSLKYIIALTAGLSLSPLHAEMVQSTSLIMMWMVLI
jgi:rare lipoprotein A